MGFLLFDFTYVHVFMQFILNSQISRFGGGSEEPETNIFLVGWMNKVSIYVGCLECLVSQICNSGLLPHRLEMISCYKDEFFETCSNL